MNNIQIINFSEERRESIKTLNYEWLEKYFRVEEGDIKSLSNPQTEIIDKGGFIFYAKLNDVIIGTASLLKKSDLVYEIGKMAVTESAQGLGIGKLLLEHCIQVAKQKGIHKLILYHSCPNK